eukprot:7376314-Prymnesium_polylepis.1
MQGREAAGGWESAAKRERRDPHRDRAYSRLGLAPGDRGVPSGRWGRGGNENSVIRTCELTYVKAQCGLELSQAISALSMRSQTQGVSGYGVAKRRRALPAHTTMGPRRRR